MCTTCQNCNCDNITLPIPVGVPGPTGATGPAGPPGSGSGSDTLVFSDLTTAVATGTTSNVVYPSKLYTLPIGKLASNGDMIKVNAYFKAEGKYPQINFHINAGFPDVTIFAGAASATANTIKVTFTILRKDNVTIYLQTSSLIGDFSANQLRPSGHYQLLEKTVSVNDLDTVVNTLQFGAKLSTTDEILTCEYMTVEILNLP